MNRLFAILASVVAAAIGIFTLIGLIFGAEAGIISSVANIALQFAVVMAGLTVLLGLLNLFSTHLRRIFRRQTGWPYSFVVILCAVVVITLWLSGADRENMILLETVQVSIESALAGLLLFTLVFGAYRLMRKRVTWSAMLFTLVLLLILLGALPIPEASRLSEIRRWLLTVPVSAGARGILLGIALATVVTGVRALLGQDRSYRE